jgi:hypothetical protein
MYVQVATEFYITAGSNNVITLMERDLALITVVITPLVAWESANRKYSNCAAKQASARVGAFLCL